MATTINGQTADIALPITETYFGAWTATSSSAYGTRVTESITIPAGLYLLHIRTPGGYSTDSVVLDIDGTISNNEDLLGFSNISAVIRLSNGNAILPVRATATSTIYVKTGQSASVTWDSSYLSRGGISAIRIGI